MIAMLTLSLSGCFGSQQNNQPATEAPAIGTYTKDFIGLQQYLIDQGIVPYADLSGLRKSTEDEKTAATTATEAATEATSTSRTAVYYDMMGADDGIRYLLSGTAFIELYDFSSASGDTAKNILADIKDDGKFILADGLDEMTGLISASGKYVITYNAKNNIDSKILDKITEALKSW